MPFHLDIPETERLYLDNLPLSPEAKDAVHRFVEQTIANLPDEFRLNPENRPDLSSPWFRIKHLIWDKWGDRRIHTLDFYINDADAKYGVLIVAYVEYH